MSNCVFCGSESSGNYPSIPYICMDCYSEIYEVVDRMEFGYENQRMYHANEFGGSMHQRVDGGDYRAEREGVVYFGGDDSEDNYGYIRACVECGDVYRTDYFLNFVCDRCLGEE